MDFKSLFVQFLSGSDTLQAATGRSLWLFLPELILCGSIVLMLLARLTSGDKLIPTHWFALIGSLSAFVMVMFQFWQLGINNEPYTVLFTGLAVHDMFSVFFRGFLLFFLVFVIALTVLSGIPDQEDAPDFYTLLCGAVVGMLVMSSANHLLMLFLGIEMASVPSYALTGFLKGRRQSSEASLKFVVYGAGAAGVMLFGISLLAGVTGTAEFGELGTRMQAIFSSGFGASHPVARIVLLAMLLIAVGFAFKLSLVPFHFWCPDAFQGASAEVAGFLSIASKAAAFALLLRFSLAVTSFQGGVIQGLSLMMGLGLGALAVITATFGNLAAYSQTNAKRMLAYSTIAHAGYMLMAVSALLVLRSAIGGANSPTAEQMGRPVEGLLYYLAVYMFMNLGAFTIVALIRNQTFSEELDDYKGLVHQSPILAVCMAICLFSLVGLPPLGGFYGKFFIFAAVFDATKVHWFMWVVLAAGGLNTVLSLFYYLRVAKIMCIDVRPADARQVTLTAGSPSGMYLMLVTGMVLYLGIFINPLSRVAQHAAEAFL
ncbi:MAG: NADH-quinone oxidoreductase subunit N [Planctomycetota bacterium]